MKNTLYGFIWRVHFYAGLIVLPFLIVLALSGSVYLFKPQLDKLVYSKLVTVSAVTNAPLSENALVEKVKVQFPEARIATYYSPLSSEHSAQFDLNTKEGILSVFYNPYDGSFLGERKNEDYIQEIARKIHGELLIGDWGDRIVELAACWAIILILTGLYLTWPQLTFLPNFKLQGRAFWRDIHISSGLLGSVFIFFLIASGLPWSGIFGNKIMHVWEQYPDKMFSNLPKSTVLTESLNKDRINVVPWATEKIAMPESQSQEGQPLPLTSAIEIALKENVTKPLVVTFPKGKLGVYTVSAVTGDPKKERLVHIDQYSGKVLISFGYADYSKVAATVQYGISLHEGKYFGLANQLLGLFACVMLILLSITGAIMWWKRKPLPNQTQFSSLSKEHKNLVISFALFFGIIFPLVGISLIVVTIIEKIRK